jgi:iron complex outermembrane receptor protein
MREEHMSKYNGLRSGAAIGLALSVFGGALAVAPSAWAQATGAVDAVTDDEIVVTATKRDDVLAQDVPGALTAFSDEQLEALNFDDLASLTYTMPNVQLEDIGTAPGVANFGIRGLGINSSIPSVDPTVGVFVDGMYYGINAGIVVDNFDLEAIEVLRGPQGTLYGRNVTGGAVLIRTSTPDDVFEVDGHASVETGLDWTADLSISGPLAPGVLSAKFAIYHNEDDGWFENLFDGSQHGESELNIYRLAVRATPTESIDLLLRLEQGFGDSDGPASQNHGQHARGTFDFRINNPGYAIGDWEQAIFEANIDVPFGDGTITNIAGWRNYRGFSGSDVDATGAPNFEARAVNLQEQWSNELRYAGTFGPVDVTAGLYWFEQTLFYIEERFLLGGASIRVGGGDGEFSTAAAFSTFDWHLNDAFTLSLGARYTIEEKEARVSRIRSAGAAGNLDGANVVPGEGVIGGSIDSQTLNFTDSPFDLTWYDLSPRVGLQWEPNPNTNIYAFWAQGFRAGGVNFRTTTLGNAVTSGAPRAFDPEEQSSFEIGWKQDFMDGRGRLNLALFHNTIEDMQRETNVPDPAGVQQVIVNAGEAEIQGAEMEARWGLTENFLITAQVGYTDGQYNEVTADLDNNGVVNGADLDQEIPRLAEWTYGVNLIYDLDIMGGVLSSRVGYNHRDPSVYNDTNTGFLAEADIIDANFTFAPNQGNWSFSVYGENLTDEATWGGDTVLPDSPLFGGDGAGPAVPTFSPLNEGRVIGAEIRVRY